MAKGGFRGGYGGYRRPAMPKGGAMGGMNMDMIQKAQKMQQEMIEKQAEIEAMQFSASAGGGMVTAVVTGKKELLNVEIDPEAVDPEDVEMLQDMIVAAVNEAIRKADGEMTETMNKLTSGLGLPM